MNIWILYSTYKGLVFKLCHTGNPVETVSSEQCGMVKLAVIDEISEFNRELEMKAQRANTFIVPDAVSEWNQFVVILKKTMVCIYRDRVNIV